MRRARVLGAILFAAAVTARCENAGEGRVLSVQASGIVRGLVYLDRNGNRQPDGADTVLRQARMRFIAAGTRDTVVDAVSDSTGSFRVPAVPIGAYTVAFDTTSVGDSVRLIQLSATQVTVTPGDSVTVTATVSFPIVSVRAARLLPLGRKVFVEGVLLSPRPAFGDTTAHLADTSRAVRLTHVRPNPVASIGDSVRVLGLTATRDGQSVLDDVTLIPLGVSGGLTPLVVTAAVASTAGGGVRDAALVFIGGVIIVDTGTVVGVPASTQDYRLVVDDTPADTLGRLEVLLDAQAGFGGSALLELRPDTMLTVTGVLVPSPTTAGRWRLKPRFVADVVVQ